MGRVVTLPLQAATTRPWVVDRDTLLISAMCFVSGANAAVLSTDPSLTAATILAAPAASQGTTGEIIMIILPGVATFSQDLKIPLSKDSTIYANSSAATWLLLLLEDLILS